MADRVCENPTGLSRALRSDRWMQRLGLEKSGETLFYFPMIKPCAIPPDQNTNGTRAGDSHPNPKCQHLNVNSFDFFQYLSFALVPFRSKEGFGGRLQLFPALAAPSLRRSLGTTEML